jgi:hypothetical protein
LQIADCRLQIADCRLQIADCGLRIADCGARILQLALSWNVFNLQSAILDLQSLGSNRPKLEVTRTRRP